MQFIYDDAGRTGGKSRGDCVCRAITVASGLPYSAVYNLLAEGNAGQRISKKEKAKGKATGQRTARKGISVRRAWFKRLMADLQFIWYPTMRIGSGCVVHLTDGELPNGRLVVQVSNHYTAVIDQVIHDTHDPQRATLWYSDGGQQLERVSQRCVYGYWEYVGRYPAYLDPATLAR